MKKEIGIIIGLGVLIGVLLFILLTVKKTNSDKPVKQTKKETQVTKPTITKSSSVPTMQIDITKKYRALFNTSAGGIVVELTASKTPITVNNFVALSRKGFYDNTIFHRVIKGFMIQGGDPEGTGRGGPGYRFDDEAFEGSYTRGTIAMANAGPNTNGSQFFIMHKDNELPKNYVIFGSVIDGMDVVDKIAEAEIQNTGGEPSSPVTPVVVKTIVITEE